MILHIAEDDKFIDLAINMFELVDSNKNVLVVISTNENLKFVKTKNIILKNIEEVLTPAFIHSLQTYDMVILHSLNKTKLKIVELASNKVKFIWLGWGFDYYTSLIYKSYISLLLPKTKRFANFKFLLNFHKNILIKILKRNNNVTNKDYETIQKISFFAPVIRDDYDLIIKKHPTFKPQYITWNYGSLEDNLTLDIPEVKIIGNNILIGNSATYENNHLDAFEMIIKIIKADQKVFVPLSYGNEDYRNSIIQKGKKMFGDRFVPLTDFIPYEEYIKTISSCSIVIMNHLRQQAVGNIVIMMHLGAKIFLNINNPVLTFFKKEDAAIYSTEELLNNKTFGNKLTSEQIDHNILVLRKHWSREVILNKTRELIKTVKSYKMSSNE